MTEDEFYEHMREIALLQKQISDAQDKMHCHMMAVAQKCVNGIREQTVYNPRFNALLGESGLD